MHASSGVWIIDWNVGTSIVVCVSMIPLTAQRWLAGIERACA
jgi:hypothetical protein